jgi:membrane-associated protein
MQLNLSKSGLRFLAWGCLFTVALAICQDCAFADEHRGFVEEINAADEGSWLGFAQELFDNLFNSQRLMKTLEKPQYKLAAFVAVNLIVFVETGLLVGFFLPGDSLLVITGLVCATSWNAPLLLLLLVTVSLAAIIGDSIGYSIGYKTGPKIFSREKSFFFHKDHLLKAQQFYERHGGKTIILARFIPILRTFAPVVAGVGRMEYRQFLFFNVIGGVSWVFSMILTGYFLPGLLNDLLGVKVEDHVEKVVIIVVLLSIAPGLFAWVKAKLASKNDLVPPCEAVVAAK